MSKSFFLNQGKKGQHFPLEDSFSCLAYEPWHESQRVTTGRMAPLIGDKNRRFPVQPYHKKRLSRSMKSTGLEKTNLQ